MFVFTNCFQKEIQKGLLKSILTSIIKTSRSFVWRHVKAVLWLGRVKTSTFRYSEGYRARTGEIRWVRAGDLNFRRRIDTRKGIAADSQHKTAFMELGAG